jgi:PAS domain-containing protein
VNAGAASDRARLRNRLLAAAVGASPAAVFTVDASGIISFAEGGGIPFLSKGRRSIEGRTAADAWAGSPQLLAAVRQALAGVRFAGDVWIERRRYAARVIPMRDREDAVTGVAGLAVAYVREAQAPAATDSAAIVSALVDSLPGAVWVLDHRGDVLRHNDLAREVGMNTVRRARESAAPGGSLVGAVLLEGRSARGLVPLRDSSGTRVHVNMRGIPLRDSKGSTVGAVLVAESPEPPPAPPSLIDPPRSRGTLPPFPWALEPVDRPDIGPFA